MSRQVFFCYARENQGFAVRLAENLKKRGIAVWLDQWDIPPQADWDKTIDKSLSECARLLIVLSPASVESREVRSELRTALDLGKPVLPVLYQPCDVPRQLRLVQYVDFRSREPDNESALDQLVSACSGRSHQPEPIRRAPAPPKRKWLGMEWLSSLGFRSKLLLSTVLATLVAVILWQALEAVTRDYRRINDAALSPDGVYLAAATRQGIGAGTVRIWDVNSRRQIQRISNNDTFWSVAWSPKGNRLAIGDHKGRIRTYEAGTWKLLSELVGPRSPVNFIAWSPDGTAVATGDDTGTLWVWEVVGGKRLYYSSLHSKNIKSAAWSPDGGRLATASWDDSVGVVDARDGHLLTRLKGHTSFVNCVAFSPDGNWLASGSLEEPYLIVWDAAGRPQKLEGHRNSVERVAWSSDGRYVASASKDNTVQFWDGRTFTNIGRFDLGGEYNSGKSLAWSPDGTRLASGDNAYVWILNPKGDVVQKLAGDPQAAYSNIEIGGWSNDGKRLVSFSTSEGTALAWDTITGHALGTFRVSLFQALTE